MNTHIPLIIDDPGHGGADRANRGPTGYVEADGVLDIGLRVKKLLVSEGYNIEITRETDKTVELYDRSRIANGLKAGLFISLHTNSGPETANGIETFYTLNNEWGKKHSSEAKKIASVVQRNLVEATGLRDRGIKTRLVDNPSSPINGKDYYAVIRRSNMPALIVEMGFHSNLEEEALLKTASFREKLARSLCQSIKEVYPMKKENSINVENKKINLKIHGVNSEIEGLFKEGRNYIPVGFLKELGYKVGWNGATQTVEIDYNK